jgi:hypothetical protein
MMCSFRLITHVVRVLRNHLQQQYTLTILADLLLLLLYTLYISYTTMAFANTASKLFSMSDSLPEGIQADIQYRWQLELRWYNHLYTMFQVDIELFYLIDSVVFSLRSVFPIRLIHGRVLMVGNGRRNTFLNPLAPAGDLVRCQD